MEIRNPKHPLNPPGVESPAALKTMLNSELRNTTTSPRNWLKAPLSGKGCGNQNCKGPQIPAGNKSKVPLCCKRRDNLKFKTPPTPAGNWLKVPLCGQRCGHQNMPNTTSIYMPDGFGTRKNTLFYMPDGFWTRKNTSFYMPDGLGTRKKHVILYAGWLDDT